jgi:hypothetical protein
MRVKTYEQNRDIRNKGFAGPTRISGDYSRYNAASNQRDNPADVIDYHENGNVQRMDPRFRHRVRPYEFQYSGRYSLRACRA